MTSNARQMTTMKYGLRMEKRDIFSLPNHATAPVCVLLLSAFVVLHDLNRLCDHSLARLQAAAIADHDLLAFLKAGDDFRVDGSLQAQLHRSILKFAVAGLPQTRLSCLPSWFTACSGTTEYLLVRASRGFRVHAGHQQPLRITNIHFGVHGARVFPDVHREPRNFPGKSPVQRGHTNIDRISDPDVIERKIREPGITSRNRSSSESFTIGMACVLELVPACTSVPRFA